MKKFISVNIPVSLYNRIDKYIEKYNKKNLVKINKTTTLILAIDKYLSEVNNDKY